MSKNEWKQWNEKQLTQNRVSLVNRFLIFENEASLFFEIFAILAQFYRFDARFTDLGKMIWSLSGFTAKYLLLNGLFRGLWARQERPGLRQKMRNFFQVHFSHRTLFGVRSQSLLIRSFLRSDRKMPHNTRKSGDFWARQERPGLRNFARFTFYIGLFLVWGFNLFLFAVF